MCKKRNPSTLVGMQIGRANMKNNMKFLKNSAEKTTYDRALEVREGE